MTLTSDNRGRGLQGAVTASGPTPLALVMPVSVRGVAQTRPPEHLAAAGRFRHIGHRTNYGSCGHFNHRDAYVAKYQQQNCNDAPPAAR